MPELEAVGVGKRVDYLLSHGFELLPDELLGDLVQLGEMTQLQSPIGGLGNVSQSTQAQVRQAMYLRRFNALH